MNKKQNKKCLVIDVVRPGDDSREEKNVRRGEKRKKKEVKLNIYDDFTWELRRLRRTKRVGVIEIEISVL